jgi:hypothetical protein
MVAQPEEYDEYEVRPFPLSAPESLIHEAVMRLCLSPVQCDTSAVHRSTDYQAMLAQARLAAA